MLQGTAVTCVSVQSARPSLRAIPAPLPRQSPCLPAKMKIASCIKAGWEEQVWLGCRKPYGRFQQTAGHSMGQALTPNLALGSMKERYMLNKP